MNIDFKSKTVVITGAASGIGLAVTKMMIEEGAAVVMLDINPNGKTIAASLSPKANFIHCDVSVANEVMDAFKWIKEKMGFIDVLVNNAGIQSYGNVTDASEESWDKTINVNLKSIFLCSKYGIPLMLKQTAPVIVNVASVKSFVCQDNEAAYVASKSAIIGLTRSIAADYSPVLRCVAVCPGAVRTPLLTDEFDKVKENAKEKLISETENIHLLKRIADPEEIANFILFLASEKASFATGQAYRVDGGIGVRIEGT